MYWEDRLTQTQKRLTDKKIEEVEKQLIKYYQACRERVVQEFENTYNKLLKQAENDKDLTPALLYKLDSYWELQGQLKRELQKLGDKQVELLSKRFTEQYQDIYRIWALHGESFFNTLDSEKAQQMINQIWCADGESWDRRIWKNTDKLQQALNDGLVHCVVTGSNPIELTKKLVSEFDIAFYRADRVVRTEMAHIQVEASRQSYIDAGVTEVMIWASKDERRCKVCGKLHKTTVPINSVMPVPAHPNCRCAIKPVLKKR